MSSSGRHTLHRRRSHSSSSPLTALRQFAGDKWRPPHKRARQSSTQNLASKDAPVDDAADWGRDGKRARRESSSPVPRPRGPCLFGSSPVFRQEWASIPSSSPTHLPSTSDAFDLFPHRSKASEWPSQQGYAESAAHLSWSPCPDETPAELTQLRSNAFWELQQSIAENGEGMVSRMRDWEASHSHSVASDRHSQMRERPLNLANAGTGDYPEEDEDEIQIIESGSGEPIACLVAGDMDVDSIDDSNVFLGTVSSSSASDGSCMSFASDEESPGSLTLTGSSNSSRASLPLYNHEGHHCHLSGVPLTASPSEKAIAALTLVMATGAGSLNDYEAVRTLEEPHITSLDDSHIGEMWR